MISKTGDFSYEPAQFEKISGKTEIFFIFFQNNLLTNSYRSVCLRCMRYRHSKISARHGNRPSERVNRFNRVLVFLQMLAALVLGCVIWLGVERVIH